MSKKELEVKQKAEVAVYDPILDEGMDPISPDEVLISRALACQALSKLVESGKAKPGQIVDSVEGTILAEPHEPVEIICFHTVRQWINFLDSGTGKAEYHSTEIMTQENVNAPWEETVPEGIIKRNKALGYFFLTPAEIEAGAQFPRLVVFTRTSYQAGRKISTQQVKLKAQHRPLCGRVFKLFTLKETKDNHTFYVFDVVPGRDTTPKELAAAAEWKRIIMSSKTKVQEEPAKEEVPF